MRLLAAALLLHSTLLNGGYGALAFKSTLSFSSTTRLDLRPSYANATTPLFLSNRRGQRRRGGGGGDDGDNDEDDNDEQDQIVELIPETAFGAEAVPENQRPVNEYLDMTKQPLFGWASQDNPALALRLGIVYAIVFALVCYPIAGATYTQEGFLMQKITAANIGAVSLIAVLLLRLYSGWGYVGQRLTSKVIEFEETGWYDGDIEFKTVAEQKRDKFLYLDKVKPAIDRLKLFSFAVAGLWVASIVGYNVAVSYNPMYDEYNPQMLERLNYDDKLAEKAAINSSGRPTYCDNRYYRAVANGGQGCDR